jgi:hypothetical protein
MNLSKKEAEQILSMLKQAQPAGMTNDDMADRAMIEYNQGLQPATGAKPLPTAGALSGPSATVNNQILASPDWAAAEQATGKLNNIKGELLSRINAGKAQPAAVTAPTPAAKPLVQGLHNAAAPAASTSKPVSPTVKTQAAVPLGMTNDDMADKMMIEDNANVPVTPPPTPTKPTITPTNNPLLPKQGSAALTRRHSGVVTPDGAVWVNPADRVWLAKSAAYLDVSWEDYKNLEPGETPENIEVFFTK